MLPEVISAYFFVGAVLTVACLANDLQNKKHSGAAAYAMVFFFWFAFLVVFIWRGLRTKQ